MAAAADCMAFVSRRQHRCAKIDAADRAAGALAHSILADRDDEARLAEAFLEAPGDDPDHARVPALRRDRDDGIALANCGLRHRVVEDELLDPAPLFV